MTYNVFGGTLNLTQFNSGNVQWAASFTYCLLSDLDRPGQNVLEHNTLDISKADLLHITAIILSFPAVNILLGFLLYLWNG